MFEITTIGTAVDKGLRTPDTSGGADEDDIARHQTFVQGFTLIEVTVVLILVGLFYFSALPKVNNFLFQRDLKAAARSLKATVNLLRTKSIATHRFTVLNLDLDRGLYWGQYEAEELSGGHSSDEKEMLAPPRHLPEGIRFLDAYNMNTTKKTFGVVKSRFNPKGILEETVIHLADARGKTLTIIINAFTGRFTLYNEYVDVEYAEK
ncbi:MAG: prepilin-type N-terminal cleavage/methylation domain-containing protein [Deltaproteobacteria bacterium]|nr:prepilin-type N-terminal cleavage/methylation domain-containing protein [Deltaproteobacteria bacterium]